MFSKQLKPLNHKKQLINAQPLTKVPASKQIVKQEVKKGNEVSKNVVKKPSTQEVTKPVKLQKNTSRTNKTIEHYDCDDFDLQVEDHGYFESQLEKNIKTEILSKTGKLQSKANIVLPKLENDHKIRNMKQLQKEMDEEMSKIDFDHGNAYD